MNSALLLSALLTTSLFLSSCQNKPKEDVQQSVKMVDLLALAASVPNEGPRTGNNYKVFFLALRQNQQPAEGFRVKAWVHEKGEPIIQTTDASGLAVFNNLPFPDSKHRLNTVLEYYRGKKDQSREIDYPYIDSDAYRLKDTQYIPNDATPNAQ